jgi:SNF2 family DNA or RNA helicase
MTSMDDLPRELGFELYSFQAEDTIKLEHQKARLVGNDMGTGKTYVGVALDQLNRKDPGDRWTGGGVKKTLILCPKSVIDVWDKHCMKLTDEDVYVIDAKKRDIFLRDALDPKKSGYFICHWDALRLITARQKIKSGPSKGKFKKGLRDVQWFHVIADEVHRAKNRKAQVTRALKSIRTTYKTGMSGTPADNKPQDLWSVLNWLFPGYYTAFWKFVKHYCIVELNEENGYYEMKGINEETLPELHKQMSPWYVRRHKKDVLPDLPDKYYDVRYVDIHPKQRKAYDQMKKTMVAWVDEHQEEIEQGNPIIAQAAVSQLIRLGQYADAYVVPKLDDDGNQVYKRVWKRDKETGEKKAEWAPVYIVTEPSAKLDAVIEILEDSGDEQVVIWSQYRSIIDLLAERLDNHTPPISYGLLTGEVGQEDRAAAIDAFQRGDIRVFAGTIQAGGVGVTLTAASTVVFIDRTWSPALNLQAEDRLHRIGQTEAVQVIDLIARNTVDLGRRQKLAKKWKWLKQILGDKLDDSELKPGHFTEGDEEE